MKEATEVSLGMWTLIFTEPPPENSCSRLCSKIIVGARGELIPGLFILSGFIESVTEFRGIDKPCFDVYL